MIDHLRNLIYRSLVKTAWFLLDTADLVDPYSLGNTLG
jgi:hypothetical protein